MTLANHHHQGYSLLSGSVWTSVRRHRHLPMIGTFSQRLYASGKRHCPTTRDIIKTILVMYRRIGRVLGTPLSSISHGLFISLTVRLSCPSRIRRGLYTTTSQCKMFIDCNDRSLHISKLALVVDWLHQPLLVHIAKLQSANKRQHHLSVV